MSPACTIFHPPSSGFPAPCHPKQALWTSKHPPLDLLRRSSVVLAEVKGPKGPFQGMGGVLFLPTKLTSPPLSPSYPLLSCHSAQHRRPAPLKQSAWVSVLRVCVCVCVFTRVNPGGQFLSLWSSPNPNHISLSFTPCTETPFTQFPSLFYIYIHPLRLEVTMATLHQAALIFVLVLAGHGTGWDQRKRLFFSSSRPEM